MSTADLDTRRRREYQVAVAQYERVQTMRDYTVIRAPFAGVVTEKYARVGQKVIEDRTSRSSRSRPPSHCSPASTCPRRTC